jgi:hypothetical protein
VFYRDCATADVAGVTPIHLGQPGYRPELDADGDGVACDGPRNRTAAAQPSGPAGSAPGGIGSSVAADPPAQSDPTQPAGPAPSTGTVPEPTPTTPPAPTASDPPPPQDGCVLDALGICIVGVPAP